MRRSGGVRFLIGIVLVVLFVLDGVLGGSGGVGGNHEALGKSKSYDCGGKG